jgi:hypothetical protein
MSDEIFDIAEQQAALIERITSDIALIRRMATLSTIQPENALAEIEALAHAALIRIARQEEAK